MSALNHLRWNCRRGMLELDIVLQRFMDQHAATLSEAECAAFARLLDEPDTDLWRRILHGGECEDETMTRMLALLREC